ncbi:SH3 and multiple ankyrin repeat domains protein 2 [Lobulomyces angularis]|nr:SH3 and multiple ankyrin repeat domains protein 2 [Lobulomyces angularis]
MDENFLKNKNPENTALKPIPPTEGLSNSPQRKRSVKTLKQNPAISSSVNQLSTTAEDAPTMSNNNVKIEDKSRSSEIINQKGTSNTLQTLHGIDTKVTTTSSNSIQQPSDLSWFTERGIPIPKAQSGNLSPTKSNVAIDKKAYSAKIQEASSALKYTQSTASAKPQSSISQQQPNSNPTNSVSPTTVQNPISAMVPNSISPTAVTTPVFATAGTNSISATPTQNLPTQLQTPPQSNSQSATPLQNANSLTSPTLNSVSPTTNQIVKPTPAAAAFVIVKITITSVGVQKALRCNVNDTIWVLKKQFLEKVGNEVADLLNHGLFLPGVQGKQGKFLEEKRDILSYNFENNTLLELIPKSRQNAPLILDVGESEPGSPSANSKKKQKRFVEDVQKSAIEKAKEKVSKGLDPNFLAESSEETPLSIAVINNDKDMINLLVEAGAFLDYRVGSKDTWKTPLHIAAQQNRPLALQCLLSFGAWANAVDILGLTPLSYATSSDSAECVHRLLLAKAETEIFDENKKGPLHQACLNNNEYVTWLLIDFGANINALNISGNTPLHVAATRNARNCAKWLLIRGCNRELLNKSGQNASQAALMSGNAELSELIKNFKDEDIVPMPPKPVYRENAEYPFTCIPPYISKDTTTSGGNANRPSTLKHSDSTGSLSSVFLQNLELTPLNRRSFNGNHTRSASDPTHRVSMGFSKAKFEIKEAGDFMISEVFEGNLETRSNHESVQSLPSNKASKIVKKAKEYYPPPPFEPQPENETQSEEKCNLDTEKAILTLKNGLEVVMNNLGSLSTSCNHLDIEGLLSGISTVEVGYKTVNQKYIEAENQLKSLQMEREQLKCELLKLKS